MKMVFVGDPIYAYATGDPSVAGGAERQQWLLARALARAGWQVTCGIGDGLMRVRRLTIDGVEFAAFGSSRWSRELYRLLAAGNADWLYWRGADHLFGVAVELARRTSVRSIFAAAFDTDVEPRRALTRRQAWWPMYAWGLWRTDRIFVQHHAQLSALDRGLRPKAVVVPSIAGDLQEIVPHHDRDSYIAWVGMLREPKRPDLLARIAAQLPRQRFVVCGGPTTHRSAPGYAQRIIEELGRLPNVRFLGKVPSPVAARVMAHAALLLSTSDTEGFPNTFLQAWSSGTPVVSIKIDPDGVIQREGIGVLAADVDAAIARIEALIKAPGARQDMAMRARRHVEAVHSEAAAVATLEHALRSC